jgi:molybdopterin molybdotransferase
VTDAIGTRGASCRREPHGTGWDEARRLAGSWAPLLATEVPLHDAVRAVLARDAVAHAPLPHYDSSAMDGWAVAGAPPWRVRPGGALTAGTARDVVTGGALPPGTEAVLATERGRVADGLLVADRPRAGAHVRRAGEEAPAGTVLVPGGTRLSPAHVAVLAIAGTDVVLARRRPRVGFVLTGDEVVTSGIPAAGRVRDAFDPLLPLTADRLGGDALPPLRVGDDPVAIREALGSLGRADVLVTVGGTGRSRADRLREALGDAATVFDGVAMRPGHPALLARLPDGRPLLGLPGNPLAAVAVLLSFLPRIVDALAGAQPAAERTVVAAVALPGWAGGSALVPCALTPEGVLPASATRPNMLRGLADSAVLAVVPPAGVAAGASVPVLPLPW